MNHKIIGRLMAFLLLLEGAFLLPPALLSWMDGEGRALGAFALTIALCLVLGLALLGLCRNAKRDFYAREGFLIVSLGWVVLSVMGALPFWFSGEIPSYVDALFETISGFTTTGASILTNVEGLSRGMLFWRSFTHWLGGMGILVFLLAIVPMGKQGGTASTSSGPRAPAPAWASWCPKCARPPASSTCSTSPSPCWT